MQFSTTTISVLAIVGGMFVVATAPASAQHVEGACGPGSGDCCSANGTAGCGNTACCECICAGDPFCCDDDWDQTCANSANNIDPTCASQCPECHCGNGACQSFENCSSCPNDCPCPPGLVCVDGVCGGCGNGFCEGVAGENCETCLADCPCPLGGECVEGSGGGCIFVCAGIAATGDCCSENETPGCGDEIFSDCCSCICYVAGPLSCCIDQWGPECVQEAQNPNGPCKDVCLPCLCGDGVCHPFESCESCPADCGPDVPADLNGDGIVDAADLAELLAAWGSICE